MAKHCLKCRADIVEDIDAYTILCNTCLEIGVQEADNRQTRIAAGDLSVPNLTDEERASVLARRADLRSR